MTQSGQPSQPEHARSSTARAVSPDSGLPWAEPGAWTVAEGVHRIPLPLPNDGLQAVNVYVLETPDGLTLIDGGWAITEARNRLDAGLATLGFGFGDIRQFLVTHSHRDHYTMASVLGGEYGAAVSLGIGDRPTLELLRAVSGADGAAPLSEVTADGNIHAMRQAGAHEIAEQWMAQPPPMPEPELWRLPDTWLEGDLELAVGTRTLDAVHTPGHTQGHYVFADRAGGMLFAGDHVLPTITPSVGFEPVPVVSPLGDFMASLTKVRGLPDLQLLPAHGPIAPSVHARVDELLAHHEDRLELCRQALAGGPQTGVGVAAQLPWTRREKTFESLDVFNAALAALETKAHLELLVARGQATRTETEAGVLFTLV